MLEHLRVRQSDVVLIKPSGVEIYDTTYGRLEDRMDREGVEVEYPGGLVLIYVHEDNRELTADIHYDPKIEVPSSQSLLWFLNDFSAYTQDMVEGRLVSPDRLTVGVQGKPGLVNLLKKRFEFRREEQRLVYALHQDPRERHSQLQHLFCLSEQWGKHLRSLLRR